MSSGNQRLKVQKEMFNLANRQLRLKFMPIASKVGAQAKVDGHVNFKKFEVYKQKVKKEKIEKELKEKEQKEKEEKEKEKEKEVKPK